MPQKFFAAPVERLLVFPSSRTSLSLNGLLFLSSLLLVLSSRRVVFAFRLPCAACYPNGVLLSAPFFTFSLPAFLFFFSFIIFFTSWHTIFFFPTLFFRQSSSQTFIFLISYIYFSNTYVYTAEFFSVLRSFTLWFYTVLLVSSARVLCTLVTSAFFLSLVMFLALTRFNFFQVFFSFTCTF